MSFNGLIKDRIAIIELLDTYADVSTRYDVDDIDNFWCEDSL